MSFKRFDQEDIVISADSITAPAWSGDNVTLGTKYTKTNQKNGESGKYYYNIYDKDIDSGDTSAAIQFSIAYGHINGTGAIPLNAQVTGNSPSSIIYKQYRTLVNGTEEENLKFNGTESNNIFVIAVERARFKEKLLPGSLTLNLNNGNALTLTDNSNYATTTTFCDAGRVFQLISGSAGVKNTSVNDDGYTNGYGSYGMFLPDAGLIILSGLALEQATSVGGIAFNTSTSTTANSENLDRLYSAINGQSFQLRSEETVSSNYVFVRARNAEFNYSTNPSNITGSGELRHSVMIDSPQAYVTAVGLYNDNNDLLAVAKLSRPLLKDFTKESLIRVKLDY